MFPPFLNDVGHNHSHLISKCLGLLGSWTFSSLPLPDSLANWCQSIG